MVVYITTICLNSGKNSPALAALESVTYRDNFVLAVKAAWDPDLAWGNTEMLRYHIV